MSSDLSQDRQVALASIRGARRQRGRAFMVGGLLIVAVPALFGWWAGMVWAVYVLIKSILAIF